MAGTSTPVFPQAPLLETIDLTARTACATRAPTATASLAGANIFEFVTTSANGKRIDSITVNAASTSITAATAANLVQIWVWNGTTAFLLAEIPVSAITPSATAAGFTTTFVFPNGLYLPATYKLFASVTVTTTASTTALTATAASSVL